MEAIETTQPAEEYQDEQDPMVRGPWAITNQTSADWALLRVAECEAEIEAIDAQYQASMNRLTQRRDELVKRAERGVGYFRFKLEEWATHNRAALLRGKSKSVALLHGKVGWRAKGGRLAVTDKDALAQWMPGMNGTGLVRTKYEPEMKAIQKHFETTGEIPPGMELEPETDSFYVVAEAPEVSLAPTKKEP